MNEIKIIRLGESLSGTVSQGTFTSDIRDPTPIILWSGGSAAAVFTYSQKTDARAGTFKQRIEKIAQGNSSKGIKSMFDVYPITFKGTASEKKDERSLDAIEPDQIFTGDVNGDGVDEMVLVRNLGSVSVYNTKKRIYQQALSSAKPDLYDYTVDNTHKVTLSDREVLFLVMNRRAYEDVSNFSAADQDFDRQTHNYIILRVNHEGIETIVPGDLGGRIVEIPALGVINRPGSSGIDEIVICSRRQDDEALYLSRHTPDGERIGIPRKIYTEVPDAVGLRFVPVLQSSQLMAYNPYSRNLYFVQPDKKVNWIRRVDLESLIGEPHDIHFLSPFQFGSKLLAAVRHDKTVYALDEEGKFYFWQNETLMPQEKKRAVFKFQATTPADEIVDIVPVGGDAVTFLAVLSRKPQTKKFSQEALEKAAVRFLSEDDLARCKRALGLKFDAYMKTMAELYCEEHKMTCPELNTLEDVQKKLPAYYTDLIDQANSEYLWSLESYLLAPIQNEDFALDEIDSSDKKDKEAYKMWLKSASVNGRTTLMAVDLNGRIISKNTIAPYFYSEVESVLNFNWPVVNSRFANGQWCVVMSLHKMDEGKPQVSHYYQVSW